MLLQGFISKTQLYKAAFIPGANCKFIMNMQLINNECGFHLLGHEVFHKHLIFRVIKYMDVNGKGSFLDLYGCKW